MSTGPEPEANERRIRRQPPTFRRLEVLRRQVLSPRLVRITVGGPELAGFGLDLPAASVRLLLPGRGETDLEMPTWNGNEFLRADGSRPAIRTFTPRHHRPELDELDVDAVLHGEGPAAQWAATAEPGDGLALSGPGRGYAVAPDLADLVLMGDESAIPAISQLLEVVPPAVAVRVRVEVADPTGQLDLPPRAGATVAWSTLPVGAAPGAALVSALPDVALGPQTCVWAAGEAAAMQRIRRHLFEDRGLSRSRATVRGYWKVGRSGAED
jgi:NADPH-dependent ferric siderophore reductase